MTKINTKNLVIMGMLIAFEIVLSRFLSINAWNMKIGFGFVPIVISAMLLGPVYAAIVAAMGDFLGAILFPIGAYFPGFTFTAFLVGLLFGFMLFNDQSLYRIIITVIIHQLVFSLLLNTLWISILYGSSFGGLFVSRLVQTGIMTVVEIISIFGISKVINRIKENII